MPLVDLDAIPQVAQAFMNEDHRVEAALLNELSEAVAALAAQRGDRPGALARFDALLRHTEEHFDRENQAMERASFPPLPVHRAEHDHVLSEMRAVREAFERGGDLAALQRYVDQAVPSWFVNHIQTMDSITARFLSMRGG